MIRASVRYMLLIRRFSYPYSDKCEISWICTCFGYLQLYPFIASIAVWTYPLLFLKSFASLCHEWLLSPAGIANRDLLPVWGWYLACRQVCFLMALAHNGLRSLFIWTVLTLSIPDLYGWPVMSGWSKVLVLRISRSSWGAGSPPIMGIDFFVFRVQFCFLIRLSFASESVLVCRDFGFILGWFSSSTDLGISSSESDLLLSSVHDPLQASQFYTRVVAPQ